jgi:hypothetical protein
MPLFPTGKPVASMPVIAVSIWYSIDESILSLAMKKAPISSPSKSTPLFSISLKRWVKFLRKRFIWF